MAVDVREIYSLAESKRDTNQLLKRLRRSGSPLVLTVKNGRGRWLFGVAADASWWWTVVGPLAITLMFLFVSLPMIETRMATRREGWAAYVRRVPLVIPWPPRA